MVDNIWTISNVFICEASVVRIGDLRTVTSVSNNLPFGRNLTDVKGISIMDQTQHYFPRNLSNFFPNIEVIRVRNIGLREISGEDIEDFPSLRQISLSVNDITSLGKDLFASNRMLQAISFDYNPVMHVAHSVFANLYNLRWLRFGNTTCINQLVDDSYELVHSMVFNIFRQCPPTSAMIAEDLELPELKAEVRKLATTVDEHVDGIVSELTVLEKGMEEHSETIGELEGIAANHEARIFELEHPGGSGDDALIPLL